MFWYFEGDFLTLYFEQNSWSPKCTITPDEEEQGNCSEVCEEEGGDCAPLCWDCWHRGTLPSPPALHAGSAEWSGSPPASRQRTDYWSSLICPVGHGFGSKPRTPGLAPRSVGTNKGQHDQKLDHSWELHSGPSLWPCAWGTEWLRLLRDLGRQKSGTVRRTWIVVMARSHRSHSHARIHCNCSVFWGRTFPQETEGHTAEEPEVHGGVRAALGGSREHEQRRREGPSSLQGSSHRDVTKPQDYLLLIN